MSVHETPAETIRRAIEQMRERADAASSSPWTVHTYPVETETGEGGDVTVRDPDGFDLAYMTSDQFEDSEHVASWDPAVALAAADLLDVMLARYEAVLDTFRPGSRLGAETAASSVLGFDAALRLARTYLGETP